DQALHLLFLSLFSRHPRCSFLRGADTQNFGKKSKSPALVTGMIGVLDYEGQTGQDICVVVGNGSAFSCVCTRMVCPICCSRAAGSIVEVIFTAFCPVVVRPQAPLLALAGAQAPAPCRF